MWLPFQYFLLLCLFLCRLHSLRCILAFYTDSSFFAVRVTQVVKRCYILNCCSLFLSLWFVFLSLKLSLGSGYESGINLQLLSLAEGPFKCKCLLLKGTPVQNVLFHMQDLQVVIRATRVSRNKCKVRIIGKDITKYILSGQFNIYKILIWKNICISYNIISRFFPEAKRMTDTGELWKVEAEEWEFQCILNSVLSKPWHTHKWWSGNYSVTQNQNINCLPILVSSTVINFSGW